MTPDETMQLKKMRAQAMTRQGEIEETEDELYAATAPKGKFSGKAANSLVEATNRLLPLFGIEDKYDRFGGETMTTLPAEFMRILAMFSKAISDAVDQGMLPEDTVLDFSMVTDDNGLQSLAGRIGMAAKSPSFKRFLSRKTTKRGGEEMEEGGEDEEEGSKEMGSAEMDKLMMSRI
jgi:hypothetical protein